MPTSESNPPTAASTLRKKRKKNGFGRGLAAVFFLTLFAGAVFTASFFAARVRLQQQQAAVSPTQTVSLVPSTLSDGPGTVNPQADVTVTRTRRNDIPLVLIIGGIPGTRRDLHRKGVSEFVRDCGATAGLNGTFFANASLNGNDNLLIGPSLCGDEGQLTRGPFDKRTMLIGRPLVLLSPTRTLILPYQPETMDDDAGVRAQLPGLTDAFLGGVWLVHNGLALRRSEMARFQIHDANDPRRRAFFGMMPDGRPVLGASDWVATSPQLARALQEAGLQEAVLLDSGFSTSLVLKNQILVTGHTSPGIPSRPVPHALVLFSKPSLATAKLASRLSGA